MIKSLQKVGLQLAISIDQLAQTIIFGVLFLFGLCPCPSADETISSVVGKKSEEGVAWAMRVEKIINWVFLTFFGEPHHCRNAIEILGTKKYPR